MIGSLYSCHNNSPGNSHLLLFLLFMKMSSAWETKGSVYNAQCNFSASNVIIHYTVNDMLKREGMKRCFEKVKNLFKKWNKS